jgi:hypothetical protein
MKYTTLVIGVMQLGAKGTNATTDEQESLGCRRYGLSCDMAMHPFHRIRSREGADYQKAFRKV